MYFFRGNKLNDSKRRVSISCIDHAFKLLNTVDLNLDEGARRTLDEFTEMRKKLVEQMESPEDKDQLPAPTAPEITAGDAKKEKTSPENLLIAEANETLDLAEKQVCLSS
jgi:hypothetical protein